MADRIRGGGMMVGTGQPTEADLRRLRDVGVRAVGAALPRRAG